MHTMIIWSFACVLLLAFEASHHHSITVVLSFMYAVSQKVVPAQKQVIHETLLVSSISDKFISYQVLTVQKHM